MRMGRCLNEMWKMDVNPTLSKTRPSATVSTTIPLDLSRIKPGHHRKGKAEIHRYLQQL